MKSALSTTPWQKIWLATFVTAISAAFCLAPVAAGEKAASETADQSEETAADDSAEAPDDSADSNAHPVDPSDQDTNETAKADTDADADDPTPEKPAVDHQPGKPETADNADKDADAELSTESKESKVAASEQAKDATETADKSEANEQAQPEATRSKVRFALLTIKDSLAEAAAQVGPFGQAQLDLRELVNRLDRAANDDTIRGVVLNIQNPGLGRGKIEELRSAIARFRTSGKKIYAQLESAMPADYLIACACDEIIMPETGVLMLPGVHAEATFYKGLLEKIGVEADFVHVGPYKAAAEPLTREKFSQPVRENIHALVDSLYDDLVTTIVKSRPLSIAQAKDVVDIGLLTATRAKELDLIDRIAHPNSLRNKLAESHQAEPLVYVRNYGQEKVDADFSGPMGFVKLMQVMMGADSRSRRPSGKKIAVVYAVGPIMTGKSERDLFGGQTMGATTIVEALRKANNDEQVAAIVLRIESPGGSAVASDLIWHETQVIEKPIVVSMGDVAASGGYYIAMGADKIFAAPGTITGSIGVVGGKLAVRGLYDKLGITTETVERGKNSGLFSASGRFTDSQRDSSSR